MTDYIKLRGHFICCSLLMQRVSESEIPFDMPILGMVSYTLAYLTINTHPFHEPNNFATLIQHDNGISDITMHVHIRKQLLLFAT